MIPSHKDRQVRRLSLARIVLVEIAHGAVFGRHAHAVEVVGIAHGLEVAADYQEVDAGPVFARAGFCDRGVDGVQGAVAAAFDC